MIILVPICLYILLAVVFFLLERSSRWQRLPSVLRQGAIGLFFGIVSCLASELGVEVMGTVANVRDAAPLTAGLLFGGPAGILAGVIGGAYRWLAVYWGAGEYTRLACTVSPVLAALLAAALRKFMFHGRRPTLSYAAALTALCEVIHMLLIILTNVKDSVYAFSFVKGATVPMLVGNTLAVCLSFVAVALLAGDTLRRRRGKERIAEAFQRGLLLCILVAFLLSGLFTFLLQSNMAAMELREVFTSALTDVDTDIRGKSDAHLLALAAEAKARYEADPTLSLNELAAELGVVEINVVTVDGCIVRSTDPALEGKFDMNSSPQSAEFMVLTRGETSLVQPYGPVGSDGTTMRKFAGMALPDGGFIQVGYSSEQFRDNLDGFVIDVTKNRHVGSEGFVAVCDEELRLVAETEWHGRPLTDIGIEPGEDMLRGRPARELCEAMVSNRTEAPSEGESAERYLYVFTFVEGYCIIAAIPEAEAMFMRDAAVYNSVFMQVLVFATLFVFLYVLIERVIIRNMRGVNRALEQISAGNLEVTVDVRTHKEFAALSEGINSTVDTLKHYIAEEAARIDRELEVAKEIQRSALPTGMPDSRDYAVSASMLAAREVGGDFYDYYRLPDGSLAFLVADVSGKGIPAALFMMTAKTILKDLAESGLSVQETLTRANEKLCENNESGMFVTVWMGILDPATGVLRYANAGHNPPLLRHGNGDFEYLRTRPGLVLAGMEGVRYRPGELTLSAGDRLFLYTDGVTEATDTENRLYGEERLLSFLNTHGEAEAADLLPALKADIDTFVGEAPQFDDITMLMLDYKPAGGTMTKKTFPARVDALGELLAFLEETLEGLDCPMKTTMALSVALEEVFVNVAAYAYGEEEGTVDLALDFSEESRTLTLCLTDRGVPFDPLSIPDPDVTLSAEERDIGGLGIFITKRTMDEITYAYENRENRLTMKKHI